MSYIGNPIVSQAFLTDQFSGTGSATAFILSVAPANSASILVSVSGVLQDPTTYGVAGTTLTFSAAPPAGTANISVRYLGIPSTGVTSTAYRTVTEITATAGQTTFTPASYNVGFLNVYQNGSLLGSADYTATNGTTVILATGATVGDLLLFESFSVSSVLNAIPATPGAVSPSYLAAAGASKAFLDVVNSDGTGAMRIPSGTTAQRPSSPQPGDTRYNTSLSKTEIWSGIAWIGITQQTYTASYLVVAGGGSGGSVSGFTGGSSGGGGAGGFLAGTATLTPTTVYTITVGAGGAGVSTSNTLQNGTNGSNSSISSIQTALGGGGGGGNAAAAAAPSGGSGGGAGTYNTIGFGTAGQGYDGGACFNSPNYGGGGGGGAGAVGNNASNGVSGAGGAGASSSITGTAINYAGGGGGGASSAASLGAGGTGGGGAGGSYLGNGSAGTANSGGGGGGSGAGNVSTTVVSGSGGSGVVILSIPTVSYTGTVTGSPTVTTNGANTVLKYTSSGTYTA